MQHLLLPAAGISSLECLFQLLTLWIPDAAAQRTPPDTPNRDSWPTLFIGPEGSRSALHVDQLHTNFWMIMMHGAKRWVFFHPDDIPLLYPTWVRGQLDPSFQPLDNMLRDESKPLAGSARRRECILRAGEVLFVPAGKSPHSPPARHRNRMCIYIYDTYDTYMTHICDTYINMIKIHKYNDV